MMKKMIWFLIGIFMAVTVSAQTSQPVRSNFFPVMKDGSPSAFVAFTQPKQTNGMMLVNPNNIEYVTDDILGKRGMMASESAEKKELYFQTSSDQLETATGTFFVTLQFYDKGKGAISFAYRSRNGNGEKIERTDRMFLKDSGIWQYHTFTLAGAELDHSMPGDSDFCILCPGIYLHAVMLTRMPVQSSGLETAPRSYQAILQPPAGYEFGVVLNGANSEKIGSDPKVFEEKTQLYKTWGASSVVDTVNIAYLRNTQGDYDFSLYGKKSAALMGQGISWTPRFKIGDFNTLPMDIVRQLQPAEGTDRPNSGPMISLWEPKLTETYARIFSDLSHQVNTQQMPRMILSFAGDWGPMLYSLESSSSAGWPDFWTGGEAAQRSFHAYLQQRYGNINRVRAVWRDPNLNWTTLVPVLAPDQNPIRKIDTDSWYRESMIQAARAIVEKARLYFPQTEIILEIADDFQNGATDPALFAGLAAETRSNLLMVTHEAMPTATPYWQLMADAARRRGVKFGLHVIGGGRSEIVAAVFYSLASEGGTLLYFSEDFLIGEYAWKSYTDTVGRLRYSAPNPRIAVVFPRTSLTSDSPMSFVRMFPDLRESFGFELVDEPDLSSLSAADYPLIFVPWGNLWTSEAVTAFENLVRSGAALVVFTDQPWTTLQGDVDFNERLFSVKLEKGAEGWRLQPRRENTQPYSDANPIRRVERRVVEVGTGSDEAFLQGLWGEPQDETLARRYGFPYKTFRWMGERGSINMPMLPGKQYMLQVDGFIPAGKKVQVFINGEYLGGIVGNGVMNWRQRIAGKLQSRQGDVNVLLRGQLWSPGEILGATQAQRVSMAVGKVTVVPWGENPAEAVEDTVSPDRPQFEREALRGSWMREVGHGVTVISPSEYVNEWVYRQMLNAIVMHPSMLGPRYNLILPPDGAQNGVYVKGLSSSLVYMNFNSEPVQVGGWERNVRTYSIPPKTLYYSNGLQTR